MNFNLLVIPTLACALVLFWLGYRTHNSTKDSGRFLKVGLLVIGLLAATPAALYLVYYAHLFDSAAWFYNFRALRYSELAASGVGFLAGYFTASLQLDSVRQIAMGYGLTALVIVIPFIKPILVPLDQAELRDRWQQGVSLQSTPSTCGPASAATILSLKLDSATSEKELARECFTYRGGTESWYLVRAFRARGFDAAVEMHDVSTLPLPHPSIMGVVLPGGAGHFVALLDSSADSATIADPMTGQATLTLKDVNVRFRPTGFFLVVKKRP